MAPTFSLRRGFVIISCTSVAAFSLGLSLPYENTESSAALINVERLGPRAAAGAHAGEGVRAALGVNLTPERVDLVPGLGERLVLSLSVENHRRHELDIAHSFEIVDDSGRFVQPTSPPQRINISSARSISRSIEVPPTLGNGYYLVRVVAGGVHREYEISGMDIVYFQVEDGSVTPIDHDTFYAQSAANRGRLSR